MIPARTLAALLLAILLQLPVPVGDGIKTWPEDRRETEPPAVTEPEPVATATPAPPPIAIPGVGNPWGRPQDPGACPRVDGYGWDGQLSWPVDGVVTRGFGPYPGGVHTGTDIVTDLFAPVFAPVGGVVEWAGFSLYGFGELVVLDAGPYEVFLAHLVDVAPGVRCGWYVERGELVGWVGRSGAASSVHLHIEIRDADGLAYDAERWLR